LAEFGNRTVPNDHHRDLHAQQAPLMASAVQSAEEYALHDTHDGNDFEHTPFTYYDLQDQVHLASLAEKKRLWWRNALITGLFIASWCVFIYIYIYELVSLGYSHLLVSGTHDSNLQVQFCDHLIALQQMDVLSRSLWIPISPFCDYIPYASAVCTGGGHQGHLAQTI